VIDKLSHTQETQCIELKLDPVEKLDVTKKLRLLWEWESHIKEEYDEISKYMDITGEEINHCIYK
jgi:hypothetical protein